MKYGLVVFGDTDNIGDDILSYASRRFLPRVDYIIDRESLDLFIPDEKECVAVIMNGWYLYNKFNWPPSPYIKPLVIGIHFTGKDHYGIGYDFIDGPGRDFFLENGSIGCRDSSTLKILQGKGIDSYFSGCLTLTLNPFNGLAGRKQTVVADVSDAIKNHIEGCLGEEITVVTHDLTKTQQRPTLEERFDRVEKLLKTYQAATQVITTRLHVALPCLALGTPVLLINDNEDMDRFADYLPLLNHCSEKALLSGEFEWDFTEPLSNPLTFMRLKTDLEKSCRNFINYMSSKDSWEYHEITLEHWLKTVGWQKDLLIDRGNIKDLTITALRQRQQELEEAVNWFTKDNDEKEKEIGHLKEELDHMKTWLDDRLEAVSYLEKRMQRERDSAKDLESRYMKITGRYPVKVLLKMLRIKY